jgi:hypothetical protein
MSSNGDKAQGAFYSVIREEVESGILYRLNVYCCCLTVRGLKNLLAAHETDDPSDTFSAKCCSVIKDHLVRRVNGKGMLHERPNRKERRAAK